ncbi:MAG: hypothetical protein FJ098_09980 [Deltaproteobacteria bacterium]|nr:hypothetical protein [Deltaproteobacteria bacterium]
MSMGNLAATVVAALALGFGAGYLVGAGGGGKGGDAVLGDISVKDAEKYPAVAKGLVDNPSYGPEDARVTILEFSEFQ